MKIIRVFSKFFRTIFLLFITLILILNTQIKCEIKIFPDHHTEDDPVFNKSQVLDITNESFYYDLGYFTEKEKYFRSPKYGINYKPRKCELIENITGSITYEDNDITSFFGNDKQGIKDIESTLELGNRFEETKLFRNTMKGFNFSCPSPIRAFHHNDFEINMTIPMISTNDMIVNVILMSDDGAVNNSIGYISLTANEYQKVIFYITPKVENEDEVSTVMNFRLTPNRNDPGINVLINGDPKLSLQFITNADGLVLSNYRVTIEDLKTLAGTVFTYDMIRSKNGLLSNCTEDEDCFIGFMCTYFNCTPCHQSCTECYQDDFNPAGLNYCKKCNVMSVTEEPKDGYCSIGYVDVTKFEDFEVKVKPDGEDYDDRHTLGFWLFLADTNLSRSKDNDGQLSNSIKNGPNPQKNDILHHVVLKDRLVITIIQRVKKFSVYCHVYEDLFSMNVTDKKVFDPKYLLGNFFPHPHYFLNFTVPSDEQKEVMVGNDDSDNEDFHKTIDGHWVHVSCAESFDHGLYYLKTVINGKVESKEDHLEHAPFRRKFPDYTDEDNPPKDVIIEVQSDKYFKHIIYDDNTLLLQFKNWHLSRSKVYFRHLTLFKEYIPIKMQYMYFDYHNIGNFYELLYYLPFDQLYYGTVYKIKGYSYEYKEEDIFLNFTKKNIKDEKDIITPALNFKHLNFPPINKKYKEIDLTPNEYNPLLKNDKQKYVYDDYQAMCCEKYLDTNKNECDDTCINFHEVPFVGVNDKSGYCDYSCQESMTCLYDQPAGNNLDYDGGFCTELSKAYNLFYRCEDNQVDYYLQYSGFYSSAKMEKKIKKMYSYMLEFWYYDDYFLKQLGPKFFGNPSHSKHFILHTNVIDFYFQINDDANAYNDNIYYHFFGVSSGSFGQYRHQEWNRIYIYSRYNRTIEEYIFTIGINANSVSISRQYYPTIGPLENIIFCDKVCNDFEEKVIHWATGYYKNFRIWDGNNASPKILAQYDTFYPDLINRVSAIKYYFPMTNKYISNNRVFDPKNKEEFVIKHGKYYFRKYNYCSTFDILEAQKKYGICNYFPVIEDIDGKDEKYIYEECNNNRCERCWCPKVLVSGADPYNCRKCRVGSYLSSGYQCYQIGSYFFKSPNLLNRNLDAKVQKITLIENKPAVTVTFWCKTFGFAGDDHIIMFQIGESLEIVFSSSDDDPVRPYGLSVVIENRLISNVFDFRNQIGDWVFFFNRSS